MLKAELCGRLTEARARTFNLVDPVSDRDLNRVHTRLMSPLAWDLGHIAAFEDLWLCQRAGGLEPIDEHIAQVYDATETPRKGRGRLPFLPAAEAHDLMHAVRARSMQVLADADLSPESDELNAGGFVWEMLIQHEQQHNETMLQTLHLAEQGTFAPPRRPLPVASEPPEGEAVVDGGPYLMGVEERGFAYDNERPLHWVEVPTFEIDRMPVTCGAYQEFVQAGGYGRREWWTDEGWAWRKAERVERPLLWGADGTVRSFERKEPLDPRLPVMNVSWYEADAFARSRGKRLPTEQEWEKAASWDASAGVRRRFPWGDQPPQAAHANLDQTAFAPAPVGSYPAGAAACGALGMIGDVWEWTASQFIAYPGARTFPYAEYSEIFYGSDYKVLRGGSWATRPPAVRNTFRNWDLPQRRQIFAGFRCARDIA